MSLKPDMDTDQILGLMDQIAATPGKNDKIAMLKAVAGCDLLKRVLVAAYNADKYGIKAVPERSDLLGGGTTFTDETWGIIARLRDRSLTGNAMHTVIADHMERLTADSAELFKRILLKDMRAGFSAETVNKVWPGLIPDTAYMRCSLPKDAKPEEWTNWEDGHISQEKADGMFANVDHEETGEVFIYSRAGTMFPMDEFAGLVEQIRRALLPGTQSHGELLVERAGNGILAREIGNGILNSVAKGGKFDEGDSPVYMIWDQIPLACAVPKGKCDTQYIDRLRAIIGQLKGAQLTHLCLIPTKIVKSLDAAYAHAGELMAANKEGTILKRRSATWKDGTSKEQVKLKLEFEVDLEIVGFVAGRDNTKNEGRVGSLVCRSSCGDLQVDVAIKGEAMRDAVEADKEGWLGKIMPVTANMIMKPSESNALYSLFLPRFTSATPRTDKDTADCLERAFAIEAAAKLGKKLKDEALKVAA